MSDWLCNKCNVGVLDPNKKVRSASGLEFGVGCPECGQWNPTISFGSSEPFISESSGPIEPGVKPAIPSYKFGEDMVWACEKCEFTPLPTFGMFDHIGHCPECGHDNSHRQHLELVAGGVAKMPSIVFGEPDTGIVCDEPNYTLIEEGKQVGKFWFDERIKRFKFEGDMEASAQIFMELVLRTLNQEK